MNLHEYQGKNILAEHGVNIQRGYVVSGAFPLVVYLISGFPGGL